MKTNIIVGSRGSKLALIQTELVVASLKSKAPEREISVKIVDTSGDRDRQTHLDRIGVNVFVKELEEALLDNRIDLAVHSLKDVPTDIPQGLSLIAVIERDDPRDVLVGKSNLAELPPGSRIGTGSLRRTVQLSRIRSDLDICAVRGNVDTRVRMVSSSKLDGVILAAAGLSRLGWQDKITQYLPPEIFLPAAGQGALVVEARSDDKNVADLVLSINHSPTWQCIKAERTFLHELGGGCRAPIGALGMLSGTKLTLQGMVANPSTNEVIRESLEGDAKYPEKLGLNLARKMNAMGASLFIAEAKRNEIR